MAGQSIVCDSDGYFFIQCSYEAGNYAIGRVNGMQMLIVTTPLNVNVASFPSASVFVRKGMTISIDAHSTGAGIFYPLI